VRVLPGHAARAHGKPWSPTSPSADIEGKLDCCALSARAVAARAGTESPS
jgi:hypothetical protein